MLSILHLTKTLNSLRYSRKLLSFCARVFLMVTMQLSLPMGQLVQEKLIRKD